MLSFQMLSRKPKYKLIHKLILSSISYNKRLFLITIKITIKILKKSIINWRNKMEQVQKTKLWWQNNYRQEQFGKTTIYQLKQKLRFNIVNSKLKKIQTYFSKKVILDLCQMKKMSINRIKNKYKK